MQPGDTETLNSLPAPKPAASAPQSPTIADRTRWLFAGSDGLRAGWRLLIFVAIVFALRFGIHEILVVLHLSNPHPGIVDFSAGKVLVQDGLAFFCVLVATLIMGAFEKRSLGDYGL